MIKMHDLDVPGGFPSDAYGPLFTTPSEAPTAYVSSRMKKQSILAQHLVLVRVEYLYRGRSRRSASSLPSGCGFTRDMFGLSFALSMCHDLYKS